MPWNLLSYVDQFVLFSGDGDFCSLVKAVQRRGVRVTVVSTISSQSADDRRRSAPPSPRLHRSGRAAVQDQPRLNGISVTALLYPQTIGVDCTLRVTHDNFCDRLISRISERVPAVATAGRGGAGLALSLEGHCQYRMAAILLRHCKPGTRGAHFE